MTWKTRFDEAAFTPRLGEVKPIDIFSLKRRKTDEKIVTDLANRDGGYFHPPAVRDEGEGRYRLIHGHHRVEAWKRCRGEETPIPANIYPSDTPDELIELLETEENLFRKGLTAAERTAQEMRWVAAFKKLSGGNLVTPVTETGEAAESGKLIPILTRARRGRGNKGMAQQVPERAGISKRAVNMRRESAAAVIDEEIDFDCDTPEELERKAADLERRAAELECRADKRQHAEPKTERPKHRERAPQEVVDNEELDSGTEEVWRAFSALDRNAQAKIILRACRRRGWGLRMGPRWRVPAVDVEPAVALPAEAAPVTYDTAVDSQPEQQEDGADVSADDTQHGGDAVSQAADQEPELAVDLPAEVAPATDAVAEQAEHGDEVALAGAEDLQDAADDVSEAEYQEPNGANLDAEHLQDAAVDISEAADQEPADATKCAYCNIPFESGDQLEELNGKLYHGFCVEDGKTLAKAKQGKQVAIAA